MRVLVFGTFDLLHDGHRFVLNEASARGELSIIVARDSTVQRIKGRSPIDSETVRRENVQRVVPDAHVILGDTEDFLAPVRKVKPDLILLGYDQSMPPGVDPSSLPCPVERLPAYKPETFKSSILRGKRTWTK